MQHKIKVTKNFDGQIHVELLDKWNFRTSNADGTGGLGMLGVRTLCDQGILETMSKHASMNPGDSFVADMTTPKPMEKHRL